MDDRVLYEILLNRIRENPDKYVAVTEDGEAILADSKEMLFKLAGKRSLRCIGHGKNRRYRHFIYS